LNRINFLTEHLLNTAKFTQAKALSSMAVYHIDDDSEFITCDNPIILRPNPKFINGCLDEYEYFNQVINPFNPENMMQVPLDKKTMLCVLPRLKEFAPELLQRVEIGTKDVVVYNDEVFRSAETWILGSEKGILNYYADKINANAPTEKNIQDFHNYRESVLLLNSFVDLLAEKGLTNPDVQNAIKEIRNNPKIIGDDRFKNFVSKLDIEFPS